MRLIFIGTPEFAVPSLRRLAADHEVTAVITQPDRPAGRGRKAAASPVRREAEARGLQVLQPESLRDQSALEHVRALRPELMVAVAYGQILRPELLAIPRRGVLNVHPSLLPRWRGASPIAGAILAGDKETGVTIMLMDEGMDSGPILAQRSHPIAPDDTTGTLTDALAEEGADLLAETVPAWLAGDIVPRQQDPARVTVTKLVRKADGAIDWSLPAVQVWRQVRAYNPWPGAYTYLDGDMVHIWRSMPLTGQAPEPPGTVIEIPAGLRDEAGDAAFAVTTGEDLLAVTEAQRPGRRRLPSADFARGVPGLIGNRFASSPARP